MGSLNATLAYLWAFLGTRVSRFQGAMRDKDRGASAVELAIITAVIIGIAGIVLAAINIFVTKQSSKISGG
jgi:Flp pilus assembly protein TadG